jgi:uncharacterized protein YndB with AHSA1/START domain
MSLAFEFLVNKETNTITIKREFAANLPLVWDAWTQPEILDQWWAPKPWQSKTKSMDFREGGQRLYAMVGPEGEEHWGITKYERIQVQKDFAGSDCFSDENGVVNEAFPQSTFEIYFVPKGDKTLIENFTTYQTLEQLEATIKMGFKEGMTMALEGLDEVLERSQMNGFLQL